MITLSTPFHLGYPALELWAQAVNKDEPVYGMLLTEPGQTGQRSWRVDSLVIACFQTSANHCVHYCRLLVGRLTMINGSQPFDNNAEERKGRAEDAWDIVKDWLWEQDFDLREAAIATPLDHRLLEGTADFLAFDKENGYHRRAVLTEPE